ncbi:hypothetical protein HDU67_000980 [Dinochytrium kinnereticum]|nr:hypothetical protein HDU67_000980 [Dinochytrium kinnereticum]
MTECKIWRVQTTGELNVSKVVTFGLNSAYSLALDTSSDILVLGSVYGNVSFMRISDGSTLSKREVHIGAVTCIAIDGRNIISGSRDRTLAISPLRNFGWASPHESENRRVQKMIILRHHEGAIRHMEILHNVLATLAGDHAIKIHIHQRVESDAMWERTHCFDLPGQDGSFHLGHGHLLAETNLCFASFSWNPFKPLSTDSPVTANVESRHDAFSHPNTVVGMMRPHATDEAILSCNWPKKPNILWRECFKLSAEVSGGSVTLLDVFEEGIHKVIWKTALDRQIHRLSGMASNRDGIVAFMDTKGGLMLLIMTGGLGLQGGQDGLF